MLSAGIAARIKWDHSVAEKRRARKAERIEAKRREKAWLQLRGALKDVYAELGGGEAYLRKEREEFDKDMQRRENSITDSDLFRRLDSLRGPGRVT